MKFTVVGGSTSDAKALTGKRKPQRTTLRIDCCILETIVAGVIVVIMRAVHFARFFSFYHFEFHMKKV